MLSLDTVLYFIFRRFINSTTVFYSAKWDPSLSDTQELTPDKIQALLNADLGFSEVGEALPIHHQQPSILGKDKSDAIVTKEPSRISYLSYLGGVSGPSSLKNNNILAKSDPDIITMKKWPTVDQMKR